MRRAAIVLLCSVAPTGAAVASCNFGTSSTLGGDAGEGADGTFTAPESGPQHEAALGDTHETEAGPDATTDGAPPGLFPTATVDFGPTDCGSAPANKTYSFTNTTPAAITYSASVGTSTAFGIQGTAAGTVAPGATGTITLTASSVPATSTAGAAITGTLTVTTDVPGFASVDVPLQVTPRGGSLTLSPDPAGFGQVQLTVQAPDMPLTLTNVGNAPVTVAIGAASAPDFAVAYTGGPAGVTVAPGGTLAGAVARFKPTAVGPETATAAIQTTGVMCASTATSVSMTGTGTTAQVTVGPDPIPFGTVPCGTTSTAAGAATITNGYGFAVNYTAALGKGGASPFTLASSSGSVPANSQASIALTPKPIPVPASVAAGAFDDTLTVTTDAPGVPPATVNVTESASGAILAVSMPNAAFGNVGVSSIASLPFTVTNTGNVAAPLTLAISGPCFGGSFSGSSTAAAGGGTAPGNALCIPTAVGSFQGSLGVTTTAALCAAAPAAIKLTATGVAPTASFSATGPSMAVTCGGAASGVQNVTITNTGTSALTFSNVKSVKGSFTVVSVPASIAPGTSGNIVVQVAAPVIGTTLAGTTADTLSFTTNEVGSPTHTVSVSVTVNGANLAWNGASSFTFNTCPTTSPYTIENTGNLDATKVIAPANTLSVGFDFTTQQGVLVAAGTSISGSVRPISQSSPSCSGTQSFIFTQQGPVCTSPLQAQVTWNIPAVDCNKGFCC